MLRERSFARQKELTVSHRQLRAVLDSYWDRTGVRSTRADGLHWSALIRRTIGPTSHKDLRRRSGVARDADGVVDVDDGDPVATVSVRAGDLILRLSNRQHGDIDEACGRGVAMKRIIEGRTPPKALTGS